jgi:hypothetical protein
MTGTWVRYPYVVSVVFATLRYESTVHLARTEDARYWRAIPYLFITFLLGWWALPWGPWLSVQALGTCLSGGIDVSAEMQSEHTPPSQN